MLSCSDCPGFSVMVGGSRRYVSALESFRKQKLMSASNGDVLRTVSFSMFSGNLPSLYLVGKPDTMQYFISIMYTVITVVKFKMECRTL